MESINSDDIEVDLVADPVHGCNALPYIAKNTLRVLRGDAYVPLLLYTVQYIIELKKLHVYFSTGCPKKI